MMRAWTALVPMKGHSERIPNKNLKPFQGKPLCFWILETLTSIPEIKKIVVNTDSDAIAQAVQKDFDVLIHQRPKEIQGDLVSMNRVIEHDLSLLQSDEFFLQTHSTNPLLRADTLRKAMTLLESGENGIDSVFSVTRHQSRFYDQGGKPVNHDPAELIRTQDLPPLFEENSNFYLFSRGSFSSSKQRIGKNPQMFPVSPLEAVDIDGPEQWVLAEALALR